MDHGPQSRPAGMLISEFASATGLSRDTIRFYVRKGLLRPSVGSGGTNVYQRFDASDVERALLIKTGQALGFTLREIAALDAEYERAGMTLARQAELMRERVAAIDAQIAELRDVRRYLTRKIAWLGDGATGTAPRLGRFSRTPAAVTEARSTDPRRRRE